MVSRVPRRDRSRPNFGHALGGAGGRRGGPLRSGWIRRHDRWASIRAPRYDPPPVYPASARLAPLPFSLRQQFDPGAPGTTTRRVSSGSRRLVVGATSRTDSEDVAIMKG